MQGICTGLTRGSLCVSGHLLAVPFGPALQVHFQDQQLRHPHRWLEHVPYRWILKGYGDKGFGSNPVLMGPYLRHFTQMTELVLGEDVFLRICSMDSAPDTQPTQSLVVTSRGRRMTSLMVHSAGCKTVHHMKRVSYLCVC